jgi:DNA-binding transcriptional ArsR family regulator
LIRRAVPSGPPERDPLSPSRVHVRSTIASVVLQPEELRELRLVHKALADVNRLRIVRRLAHGEATVTELVAQVGLSQPLVSWHVGRLRTAGLITTRRSGRETFCRLLPEAFDEFATRQAVVLGLTLPDGDDTDRAARERAS